MAKDLVSQKIETNKPLCCPRCSKELNGATGEAATTPNDGDVTVCLYCACILKFTGRGMDLQLVRMTGAELGELKKENFKSWKDLMKYHEAIISLMANDKKP